VAPDSSAAKRAKMVFMMFSCPKVCLHRAVFAVQRYSGNPGAFFRDEPLMTTVQYELTQFILG
jgi:hypothetical protein